MRVQGHSEYFSTVDQALTGLLVSDLTGATLDAGAACSTLIQWLVQLRVSRQKVMLIGNGGSASVASHILMDLSNAAFVRSLCFHDAPMLTALANDYGYPAAFERCVKLWADPNDVLIATSSSGKSENILKAVAAARGKGCRVVTLSGFSPDNPLRASGDLNFYVPSNAYGHVEMAHSVLAHYLTDQVVTAVKAEV